MSQKLHEARKKEQWGENEKNIKLKTKRLEPWSCSRQKNCLKLTKKCDASNTKMFEWRNADVTMTHSTITQLLAGGQANQKRVTSQPKNNNNNNNNWGATESFHYFPLKRDTSALDSRRDCRVQKPRNCKDLHHPLASFLHAFSWCNDEHWLNAPETFHKVAPRRRMTS